VQVLPDFPLVTFEAKLHEFGAPLCKMSDNKALESDREKGDYTPEDTTLGVVTEIVNASGHRDQLDRQYGILSICGMALTVDNAWVAIGTSLNVAICRLCDTWNTEIGADCSFARQWGTPRRSI
jgi:hypothetical protein